MLSVCARAAAATAAAASSSTSSSSAAAAAALAAAATQLSGRWPLLAALQQQSSLHHLQAAAPHLHHQHHHQQHHQQHQQHHQQHQQQQQWRGVSTSGAARDLREFLDAVDPQSAARGTAWPAALLRTKSFDDLWKLWHVCLKERNMLLTQMAWEAREEQETGTSIGMTSAYVKRYRRVKLTMNRIKQVLSERAHNEGDAVKAADMKRVIHYL